MNKYFTCTIIMVLFLATTFSQKKKDSLLTVIANELCTVITNDSVSYKNQNDISVNLGLAMLPLFNKYQDNLKEFFDMDLTNSASMEEFGKEVGIRLAYQCPKFLALVKDNKSALLETSSSEMNGDNVSAVKGTLIKIVPGDFTYFIIKNTNGKSEKIWWMQYFKGSEKITSSNLNKNFKVTFKETDVYNAALKDYIKQKVAVSVE